MLYLIGEKAIPSLYRKRGPDENVAPQPDQTVLLLPRQVQTVLRARILRGRRVL